jgi:hypothetical protein
MPASAIQAQSWKKPRRVEAKVEWHPGELYPHAGFIVTHLVTRTLAMPKAAEPWSLTSLREELIKIGAKAVSHGRYVAAVATPRQRSRMS